MSGMIDRTVYTVERLSPVHIGSGKRLREHEVAVMDGRLERYDVNRLLELLANDHRALEVYTEQGAGAVVRRWRKEERRACVLYAVNWPGRQPREVLEHIADVLGRLYLPGSSIKGAIRTGVAWSFLQDGQAAKLASQIGRDRRREWAGQPLMQAVLGAEPNRDLLRAFRVFDSTPLSISEHVGVVETKSAVAEPNGHVAWLRGKGQHVAQSQDAFSSWVECTTSAASHKLQVVIERDAFLLEGKTEETSLHPDNPPQALGFDEGRRRLISEWVRRCNAFARHVADGEVRFGQRLRMTAYVKFHEERLREMEQSDGTVYLILGWGTGWRTKTVTEAFGDAGIRQVRQLYRLGRGDLFPKTRKIIFDRGQPTVPLGWVRLRPQTPARSPAVTGTRQHDKDPRRFA